MTTADGAAMNGHLLEGRGLVKNYGHVRALQGADFDVFPGEVAALVGDNGAGRAHSSRSCRAPSTPMAETSGSTGHTC